ncbi:hypothetical protein D3C80_1028990 [compost metagenome]
MVQPGNGPGLGQALQHAFAESADAAGDEEDHQGNDQPRYGADDGIKDVAQQFQQVMIEAFPPGPGIRKALQDEGQPFIGEKQHNRPVQQRQQTPDQRKQVAAVQQRGFADFKHIVVSPYALGQPGQQFAPDKACQAHQSDIQQRGHRTQPPCGDQKSHAASLLGLIHDLFQVLAGLRCSLGN